MLVVVAAALVTGLLAQLSLLQILNLLGVSFLKNRFLFLFVLTLPIVGLLEHEGLQEQAQAIVRKLRAVTPGRLLFIYHLLRQVTAALGLTSLGGHAQTVRPLIAPAAAAAAEKMAPTLPEAFRQRIFAMAAATDNIALLFGEDLFVAFGAVLLIKSVFAEQGVFLEPLRIAVWGFPTAVAALVISAWRLRRLDRQLRELS